jgi:DNA-binding NarL/FixJ family response regulator
MRSSAPPLVGPADTADTAGTVWSPVPGARSGLPCMHLLKTYLVEDSPLIRDNLIATLEELGPVQVVGWAADEATAVRWLGEPANDATLVIVDIFLQGGSGLGVLRASPQYRRGLHLVTLSNYATPEMRRRCLELGAERMFDKSGEVDELIAYCTALAAEDQAAALPSSKA